MSLPLAESGNIPMRGGSMASLAIDGRPQPEGKLPEVGYQPVSDDLFKAMGVPLKRGRSFGPQDRSDTPGVAILSESLARQLWPNGDAIGARIRLGPNPNDPWNTVVGIVGDVRMGVAGESAPDGVRVIAPGSLGRDGDRRSHGRRPNGAVAGGAARGAGDGSDDSGG